jgi:pimeloyl-ACP methyl ester carboxylesterase
MDISIKQFGRPDRGMVGVLQQARLQDPSQAPARARYLLCRPMGQEAVRAASVFRVLSERLAREGCDVLRFDYHGTGDSPGEEDQQSLEGWVEDTLAAHEQLNADAHWFGMGLGANIALHAALRAKSPPKHLVLWEPILSGPGYVQALLNGHRAELTREFGHPWDRLLRLGKVSEPTLPGDVLGFQVGPQLANDLLHLQDLPLTSAARRGIQITCCIHDEHRAMLAASSTNPLIKLVTVTDRIDWMSSQAMGTTIVPPDLPRTLLSTLN